MHKKRTSNNEILESDRRDSNPRPQPWQGCTPPTEPLSHKRVMGIEPTYLAWKASVLPLNYTRTYIIFQASAQNRNRTSDTRIFSPLLYQLSYLGISTFPLASPATIIVYNIELYLSTPFFNFFIFLFLLFFYNSSANVYLSCVLCSHKMHMIDIH